MNDPRYRKVHLDLATYEKAKHIAILEDRPLTSVLRRAVNSLGDPATA